MKKHLLLLSFTASLLCAQTLSLTQAIEQTLQTHPDIKNFALSISKSEQNSIAMRSAFLPHINFNAQYDPQHTYVLPNNGTFSTKNQANTQVGVVLEQKLFDFQKSSSLIDSAKVDEEIAKLSLKEIKNLLIYKVKLLYESALIQQEVIKVHQNDLKTKEELYKQSLAFLKQGLKTASDSSRFLAALYQAKDTLSASQAEYQKSINSLSLYTAAPIAPDTVFEKNPFVPTQSKLAEQALLQNNTELQIYDKTVAKRALETKASKAEHYGSLDLSAAYTHFENLNAYDTNLVSLTLNIPIFSGYATSAKEQQSAIATKIAKEAKASKELLLKEELGKLLIDKTKFAQTLLTKQVQIDSALEAKNLLEARYKEGLATYIELLDIVGFYEASKLELLEASYNLSLIQHKINYLTGENL